MDVAGKKAVIFGGTSGIGLAAAKQLGGLGAEVVAISRNPDKAGDVPAEITLKKCDVTDRDAVATLCAEYAPIDILISAATGGPRAIGPFLEMDLDGYQDSFQKLWGYANVVRFGARHVTDDGSITLVSGAPARNCRPGQISLSCVGGAVESSQPQPGSQSNSSSPFSPFMKQQKMKHLSFLMNVRASGMQNAFIASQGLNFPLQLFAVQPQSVLSSGPSAGGFPTCLQHTAVHAQPNPIIFKRRQGGHQFFNTGSDLHRQPKH